MSSHQLVLAMFKDEAEADVSAVEAAPEESGEEPTEDDS